MKYDEHIRLVKNAEEWNAVHVHTPFSSLEQFDPWRVYVDVLHCLDLACSSDCLTSFLMIHGKASDRGLNALREDYMQWCVDNNVQDRATHKMFTLKALKASSTEYAAVSQKILKGGACRMMCYWACGHATQRASEKPGDAESQILGCMFHVFLWG